MIRLQVILTTTFLSLIVMSPSAFGQDIVGGAKSIFGSPKDPDTTLTDNQAKGGRVPSAASKEQSPVDDAIELGNSARNRKPPDLEAAQRAYELALKLDRRDPRGHVGLANVYMDQGRYGDAARAYREAIRLGRNPLSKMVIGSAIRSPVIKKEWSAYLAIALIGENELLVAENELRQLIRSEPDRAETHALLGYCLMQQKRFTAAEESLSRAIELNPTEKAYQDLKDEAARRGKEASSGDAALIKLIQESEWQPRTSSPNRTENCKFLGDNRMRCDLVDSSSKSWYREFPTEGLRWSIRDGVVEIIETRTRNGDIWCVGRMTQDEILFTCGAGNGELKKTLIRLKK